MALCAIAGWSLAACFVYASLRPTGAPPPAAAAGAPGVVRFAPGAPQLSALQTVLIEEVPLPLTEPLSGRIVLDENRTARVASPISGRVVSLRAQPGDRVRAGDALAVLNAPELAAAVADLEKARADEQRKRRALERAEELSAGEVLARKDLEAAQADYRQAQAESRRAALRLRNLTRGAGATGEAFVLRSPISGVVVDRQVNPASEVRPDLPQPLFVVTDPARLWVLVDLPERDLGKASPGALAIVESDAYPGRRFAARVEKIGETVDSATRRVQVRCALPNADRDLKAEMYVRVTLATDPAHKAPRVPNTALVSEGLKTFVFVERGPGDFVRRPVTLQFRDRDYSYVAEGVAAGERVVSAGALLLNAELREGG